MEHYNKGDAEPRYGYKRWGYLGLGVLAGVVAAQLGNAQSAPSSWAAAAKVEASVPACAVQNASVIVADTWCAQLAEAGAVWGARECAFAATAASAKSAWWGQDAVFAAAE